MLLFRRLLPRLPSSSPLAQKRSWAILMFCSCFRATAVGVFVLGEIVLLWVSRPPAIRYDNALLITRILETAGPAIQTCFLGVLPGTVNVSVARGYGGFLAERRCRNILHSPHISWAFCAVSKWPQNNEDTKFGPRGGVMESEKKTYKTSE